MSEIGGKRVTCAQLTGGLDAESTNPNPCWHSYACASVCGASFRSDFFKLEECLHATLEVLSDFRAFTVFVLLLHVFKPSTVIIYLTHCGRREMWMIRQFNLLADILKTELGLIRDSIQEQIRAIRDAYEADRQTRDQIPARLSELRIPENEKRETRTYRERNFAIQVVLAIGTWGAFIAASVYAGIAAHQLKTMNNTLGEAQKQTLAAENTLGEVQKQTALLKQQLEGTEAAYIYVGIPRKPDSLRDLLPMGLVVEFTNLGKINALNFNARTSLQLVNVPTFRPIGSSHLAYTNKTQFFPNVAEFGFEQRPSAVFSMDKITQSDINEITGGKTTYEITTSFTYDNGFGRRIGDTKCFIFVYSQTGPGQTWNEWLPCDFGRSIYRNLQGGHSP